VTTMRNASGVFLSLTILMLASPLCAQLSAVAKTETPAIEVKMIQAVGQMALPAEFQVALYEDLIQEFEKESGFSQVFRDGDRDAAKASDVVSLYATVTKFKQGSELERDVTTVGGSTLITVHCQFKAKDGAVLLERDIQGKVRLIGDNLKATDDFAKKAAKITPESLSAATASSSGKGLKGGI
jgi:hypothetical protein